MTEAATPEPVTPETSPALVWVHTDDGEVCTLSSLDHDDPVCVHGLRVVEQWVEPPC